MFMSSKTKQQLDTLQQQLADAQQNLDAIYTHNATIEFLPDGTILTASPPSWLLSATAWIRLKISTTGCFARPS